VLCRTEPGQGWIDGGSRVMEVVERCGHCGMEDPDVGLEMETWRRSWTFSSWRSFLGAGATESDLAALRQCTHTGRPLGTPRS
jgi:hypothetical protein